jgi:UDP-N-acetylmuramoylalanine--D-glutamate ligase
MTQVALVLGLGVTGESVSRHLLASGWRVIVLEERPSEATRRRAAGLTGDLEVIETPDADRISALVNGVDIVVPSPGVRPGHPAVVAARQAGIAVESEIEVALRQLGDRRVIAITGTNGKTTVATMVAAMLVEDGQRAVAAGNIGLPMVEAVEGDAEVFVVEASSFQLEQTESLRPEVATWLNFAADHLDWHPDLDSYAAAKARIWRNQGPDDVAVVNADDPVVMAHARSAPGRVVTFAAAGGQFHVAGGPSGPVLAGPDGEPIVPVDRLPRRLPLDIANALAAAATARSAGVSASACAAVLARFQGLPHRVQLVGHSGGVGYYDDSKATTPASVLAALEGFDSVVLIAGGRNKGLDLSVLAGGAGRVRAVVAIGDAAGEVEAAFAGVRPVTTAASMDEAVSTAASLAQPGDAVLLSPGCASFDWYSSYAERGDDFARAVAERSVG